MAPHATATDEETLVSQVQSTTISDSQPVKNVENVEPPKIAEKASLRTVFPEFVIEEHPIDEFPRIKVVVVGAGMSGINAGILLPRKVPNIDLVILERHSDLVRLHLLQRFSRHKLILPREERGTPTNIRASNVISQATSTKAPSRLKQPGPRTTPPAPRSRNTGRRSPKSTMPRSTSTTTPLSRAPTGPKRRLNGSSPSSPTASKPSSKPISSSPRRATLATPAIPTTPVWTSTRAIYDILRSGTRRSILRGSASPSSATAPPACRSSHNFKKSPRILTTTHAARPGSPAPSVARNFTAAPDGRRRHKTPRAILRGARPSNRATSAASTASSKAATQTRKPRRHSQN